MESRPIGQHKIAEFTQNGLDSLTFTLYIAIDIWIRAAAV